MEALVRYRRTSCQTLPIDWRLSTVGREFDIQLGKMLDMEKNTGVFKPYLGNRAVQWGRIDTDTLPMIALTPTDLERYRLRDGDLLVCEGGEVGRAAIWDSPIEECYYQKALHRLRPLCGFNTRLMLSFLQYWADRGLLKDYVTQTSIAHLPKEKLETVPLPLPPLPEQRAIATALGDVDDLISSLDKLIGKKRAMKQAAMQLLLTGKKRLPWFEGEWATHTIGDMFRFLSTANNPRSDLTYEGDVGYIHYGDIHTKWTGFLDCKLQQLPRISAAKVSQLLRIDDGDLIMVDASEDYGGTGASVEVRNVCGKEIVAGLHTLLLRADKGLLADGFKGYLQYIPSFKSALIRIATGISVFAISKTTLKYVEIQVPGRDEQLAIASVLSDMDAEIAALEKRRDKTRLIKQGMMQELLTGKTRLI